MVNDGVSGVCDMSEEPTAEPLVLMRGFASSHGNYRLVVLTLGWQWKTGKQTFPGCEHGGKCQGF